MSVDEAVAASVDPAGLLGRAIRDRLGAPAWLFVEEKGPSVAFHYRSAADHAVAKAAVEAALDEALAGEASPAAEALERIDGRRVIEFRPRGAGGKGEAMARLLERERPATVLMMGDDRTDAEAFATVRARRAAGALDALLVGIQGAAETPPEVRERADVMLSGPPAAARLLSAIANALEAEARRRRVAGGRRDDGVRPSRGRPVGSCRAAGGMAAGRRCGSQRGPGADG